MATFRNYLATIKVHTGEHKGNKLFHAVCPSTDRTTINFLYFPQHDYEVAQVLNGIPCILSNELGINPVDFITLVGMKRATFGTWDPVQRIFTSPNYLNNKETMHEILKGTGLTDEDL